jgi:hypothetical protein
VHNHTGFIYLLQTPCLPRWVKIGYSVDVKRRIKELNTAVPVPFRALGVWTVQDHRAAEILIHKSLDNFRSNSGSEHFQLRTDLEHLTYIDENGFEVEETSSYQHELIDFVEITLLKNGFSHEFAHDYFEY